MNPKPAVETYFNRPRRLEIHLRPLEVLDGCVRHSCVLRRIDGSERLDTTLWYELPAHLPRIASDDAEPFLLAALMDAMGEDRDLHAHGRVGFQILSNLHEFMVAWSRWLPATFRVVRLTADEVAEGQDPSLPGGDTAVTPHTGGIDATSTLFRHTRGLEGPRTRRIVAVPVLHGFLIPLENQAKFDASFALAKEALDSLGLEAHPLRTNIREVVRTHWSHVYEVAMVSALRFFKPMARSCLINAPKPYDDLLFPRGSNPITDPLLSSDSFRVLHDGSRYDRIEKTAMFLPWKEGVSTLRVCWAGSQIGANCGVCEECLRTKLVFLALGEPIPASFGEPPTPGRILSMDPIDRAGIAEFRSILAHCRRHGVKASWVGALRLRIALEPVYRRFEHQRWLLKRAVERGLPKRSFARS